VGGLRKYLIIEKRKKPDIMKYFFLIQGAVLFKFDGIPVNRHFEESARI